MVDRSALCHTNPDWIMIDQSVVNWLYTIISSTLVKIVMQPDDTAYSVWHTIERVFKDNQVSRAVYLEAEFRSLQQGEMAVTQYCTKLKSLADQLHVVGQLVKEDNQVVNMLCGPQQASSRRHCPHHRERYAAVLHARPINSSPRRDEKETEGEDDSG